MDEAKTKEELSRVFLNWLKRLGKVEKITIVEDDSVAVFEENFDLSWFYDETLSIQQQSWVDAYLTVEQYNYSRRILLWSNQEQHVQMSSNASAAIKSRLDNAFSSKYRTAWWLRSIPIYTGLLAMLLTGLVVWLLFSTPQIQVEHKEVIVHQIDTIIQAEIVYKDSIVEKTIVVEKNKNSEATHIYIRDTIYSMPIAVQLNPKKQLEEPIQRYSLKESKDLLEWTVKVD